MFRKLLIVGTLVLSGCALQSESEHVVVAEPVTNTIISEHYNTLCGDIHLRKDERSKVELESSGVDWDTLECRRAALEEFKNANAK